jgi:hypothetical protein
MVATPKNRRLSAPSPLTARPKAALIAAAIVLRLAFHASNSLGAGEVEASPTAPAFAPATFQIDYSVTPDADALLAHDVSILNPDGEADLKPGQALGNHFLAYLSIAELAPDANYRAAAEATGVAFPASNELWNSRVADISDPRWHRLIIDQLAAAAVKKGFDGFFLDTVDSIKILGNAHPQNAEAYRKGAITLIHELHQRFPEMRIIVNRGFTLFDEIRDSIDGVLIESVLRSYDFQTKTFVAVPTETTERLRTEILRIRKSRLPVFATDYLPADPEPANAKLAAATVERLRELDCIPLISTPKLDGTRTPWNARIARRILVLHGHDPQITEQPRIWPADTTTHSILQMPLEWMGYEVEYHDISLGLPANGTGTGSAWAGVIIDDEIEVPPALEEPLLDWLLDRHSENRKLLFVGDYPFSDEILRHRLFSKLGIIAHKSDDELLRKGSVLSNPRFTVSDAAVMDFELKARPSGREFQNIQAPDGARVLLSVAADAATGAIRNFDAVYTSSWGGSLLAPYVVFEASEETVLTFVDPFAFLDDIWPTGKFPVPDPSTRDGLRAFYTHIDGDGFSSRTSVEEGQMCGEFLYKRLLRDLPFPTTVSVVEAEIRGHMLSQEAGEQTRCEAAARRIFELPQVEPASHSYSHPYVWFTGDDAYSGLYGSENLDLKLTARYPDVVTEREIAGSINYIDQHLTPKDKPATIMLWSGNCRPGVESLQVVSKLGIESMNGGNTILSKRFPGLSAVAPRINYWDSHLQVYASNQNEFMYTNGWNGPYYGGFRQVIETFEMTEGKRRLKPVNVYYHFYSVERPDALKALEDIYDWCKKQPLHAITTSEFAALTRDSHHTSIHQTGPRQWTTINNGDLRTFRFPKQLGIPDLHNSRGITGYTSHHDSWYVHTDGSKKSIISLADTPAPHLHLTSSSAEIEFHKLNNQLATFRVDDFRPVTVVLGGIEPGKRALVDVDGTTRKITADQRGMATLELPNCAEVRFAIGY